MGKALYFECGTGISGDMTAAALLDLGADRGALERMLESLPVSGFRTEIRRVQRAGLDVCDFSVILDADNHDHDMEYLYGHTKKGEEHPAPDGGHDHHHDHEHEHAHEHDHHHSHEHRGLAEVLSILRDADMTPGALALAEKMFRILAAAEGKAHGLPEDQVHFHEVGAVDSIIDIAAAAVLLDSLGIRECVFPVLCEGSGSVRCAHGILPVPVPAVLNIAEAHGLPLRVTDQEGELVTPTGAAIAAAVMTATRLPNRFRVLKTGVGAGKRAYARPSLLRVMLVETLEEKNSSETPDGIPSAEDRVVQIEANLDDCTGETLGYTMECLFAAGAKDVWFTPIIMKKSRPGYQICVLCGEEQRAAMEEILFRETTTIGVRRAVMARTVLPRETIQVETVPGTVQVKRWHLPDGTARCSVEYESAASAARQSGIPLMEITEQILREME